MTYLELKTAIADWLNRSDLNSVIPVFITLAETEMNRRLRVSEMEAVVETTTSGPTVSLPEDFLEFRRVMVIASGRKHQLRIVTADQLSDYEDALTTGVPTVGAVVGRALRLAPTPAFPCSLEMWYYRRIPALSDNTTSNWVLEKHPDLYLYGALMHSAPYLRDDERVGLWASKFQQLLDDIGMQDERALYGSAKLAATSSFRW